MNLVCFCVDVDIKLFDMKCAAVACNAVIDITVNATLNDDNAQCTHTAITTNRQDVYPSVVYM